MRTRVYVDGFNLYYGALKGTSFRWLDPVKLAYRLVPSGYKVDLLRYFTARVSGKADSGAPGRQHAYLQALASLPEVQVHMGRFLAKTIRRPLTNLPIADKGIDTPERVFLPAGILPVEDGDIGCWPRSALKGRKDQKPEITEAWYKPSRSRGSHNGGKRLRRESRSISPKRRLEELVRCRSGDFQ